ncbi:MAG: AraC family transcriptional regulator [Sphingobacteriales bacterium]|nr:MAG: AraC family transcriptional regulator [Sphingobacteriales bacterium]
MFHTPNYHFTIERQADLLADMDLWEPAQPGVFEKGHFHSYYEILVFRKGGGTHQMADEVFEVEDFSVHILANNKFHELRRTTATDGFEIIFSEVFLEQLQQFDRKTNYIQYFSESRVLNFDREAFESLEIYFRELVVHRDNKSIFCNLVSLILLKLISSDLNIGRSATNVTFEKALLSLLQTHYKEKPGAAFYAAAMNMSLNTFQRHTKSAFGKSLMEVQNEKILQEVKFLLTKSEVPIKEISLDFNFTDESHFTHFFRKHIGTSPSAFRRSSMS